MQPHEKMLARWLTEEWDGINQDIPKWLRIRVWLKFPFKDLNKPNALARTICLRLLENHKNELSLSK